MRLSLLPPLLLPKDLHRQLDQAESQIKEEQQKTAASVETTSDLSDQLAEVKSALGSKVMELDTQLLTSQRQCSELEEEKVGSRSNHYH